jgi:NAD(P)-dependent dehydrogenase (short-subunit alcohol dehydrogenase family)
MVTLSMPVPMGQPGMPREVANAALFLVLVNDESSYFTGKMFHPDGN